MKSILEKIIFIAGSLAIVAAALVMAPAPVSSVEALSGLTPGEYVVTVQGNNGDMVVAVELSDSEIISVEVLEHQETPGLADPAISDIPTKIVDAQSAQVEAIAGATVSSKAIMSAVEEAIRQADPRPSYNFTAGTYTVEADGNNGPITFEIEVNDSKIVSIKPVSHTETEGLGDNAFNTVIPSIITAQSTDVDTVAGSTVTSNAIITAVEEAIAQASGQSTENSDENETETPEESKPVEAPSYSFNAGTYEVTTDGLNGKVTLEVVLDDTSITSISVKEHSETAGLGDKAMDEVINEILSTQSTSVDTVAGATISSNAVINAVNEVIEANQK